ncbi:DUF305 domain-containing protein [Micromonospora zhanjiangensis]|uniref:DUF305 domain-containing protein n=1 Tax=Micromonospora zhanjiangensis TaxID=1522057 RepID=A0ABV8KSN6_9ACTN
MAETVLTDETAADESAATTADPAAGTAPRYGVAALALAVVVGLLLGYAGGWLTPQLTRPGDTSAEAGFARDMSTHHAQAVDMGLIVYRSSTTPGIRQIGVDIATQQQGEIGTMQTWLRNWGLGPTGSQPAMAWMPDGAASLKDGLMPGMATPAQMEQLRQAQGKQLDALFCDLMIQHHIGGIHMADAILAESDNAEVVKVASTMKNVQQTELNNLRSLLADAKKG